MNEPGTHDDEVDSLLRGAMVHRQEPAEDLDIARRVVAMAKAKGRRRAPARNIARRQLRRVTSWLAVVLIAVILVSGWHRLSAIQSAGAAYESSISESTSTSSSNEVGPILFVGCVALAATLVYLAVRGSIESDEADTWRGMAQYQV
jgi:hypothetical protein